MARTADSQKIAQWRQRMARFERTQTSVTQFCRDEGVSVPAFYQWRKRLAPQSAPDDRATVAHHFTPVRLVHSANVTVQLPGGTQLQIPTADPQALLLVIESLARVDADRAGGDAC